MATKKKAPAKKAGAKTGGAKSPTKADAITVKPAATAVADTPAAFSDIPEQVQAFLERNSVPKGFVKAKLVSLTDLRKRATEINLKAGVSLERLLDSVNRIKPAEVSIEKLPEEVKESVPALRPSVRRFHGMKIPLYWFPLTKTSSRCADKFGYMSSAATRAATKLPFNAVTQALLGKLGDMMGDAGRDPNTSSNNPADAGVSNIPAGFTYFGQFVDHDITLDVSSSLDADTDANTINNMRSPALDLDSVYGRGPGLDPFLYAFPSAPGIPSYRHQAPGGDEHTTPVAAAPAATARPRVCSPRRTGTCRASSGTQTAVIGDPRNDENLIIVQFQHAMLRFHNAVVDLLLAASFAGDIFAEAKRIVTHHYQWAVVQRLPEENLRRRRPSAPRWRASWLPSGSAFRMPVEFAVAAYRFGHSMIRDNYWVNFNFPTASMAQVFQFNRNPLLPVLSNWVVDFNAFFDTGVPVPVNNKARKIDSVLANESGVAARVRGDDGRSSPHATCGAVWRSGCRAGRAWPTPSASRR